MTGALCIGLTAGHARGNLVDTVGTSGDLKMTGNEAGFVFICFILALSCLRLKYDN